ncbi:MAG: hypothetical protein A3J27_08235 [Candidatus Tectomicrobia bacterium RIFCSPLOWO2_12_FULL_69_37]|nr:MAG: hypothetical protein A3I72_07080 [Candidatus Tectomicrobia bacterium RIFCSPLOWO2_02_FULL_70_19]OGL61434.1 MAG: hypothetical protein A3J27_08235 [Candidatus Tectomicrobia bacterium RIFCSPLOWO2_12_FULL_69_37]
MAAGGWREMADFARLLGDLRRREPWGRKLSRHRVFRVWEAAVGGALARVARPAAVRHKRLFVEVNDSAWLQELKLREAELLGRLNEALGAEEFTALTLRLGEWAPEAGWTGGDSPAPSPARIAAEDEPAIEAALAGLGDPELRESAERLLHRARRRSGALTEPSRAVDRGKKG